MVSFESEKRKKEKPMHGRTNDRIKGRSPSVHRAVLRDDKESLSAFGRKGAEVANKKKADKAEEQAYYVEKTQRSDEELRQQANEHIVPVDDTKEAA